MKKMIFGKIIDSCPFDTLIEVQFENLDLGDFYKPRFNLHESIYMFKNKNVNISCLISEDIESGLSEFKQGKYKTIKGVLNLSRNSIYGDRSINVDKFNVGKLLSKQKGKFLFLQVES